jgi:hypothetical protein
VQIIPQEKWPTQVIVKVLEQIYYQDKIQRKSLSTIIHEL